jgi:hypothetical protein
MPSEGDLVDWELRLSECGVSEELLGNTVFFGRDRKRNGMKLNKPIDDWWWR